MPVRMVREFLGCKKFLVAALVSALLAGCGLFSSDKDDKTANWTAEQFYTEAMENIDASAWSDAIKNLQALQTRYPFGRYAQQALMEECYAQWKDNETELALSACDRFIKQYPNHPNVDYVYYLKGLVNFHDDLGLFGFLAKQDLSERDPNALRDAFDAFREVVNRFPQSRYAPDSISRMAYIVNALAGHEIHVATYYLYRGAYLASVERAQGVLKNYQRSPATEDALEIMVRAYDKLDMPQLRDDAKRVLAESFPDHDPSKYDRKAKSWYKLW